MSAVEPVTSREAIELLGRTAFLLDWCFRQGVDLRPEIVFAPDLLDRFLCEGCAHLTAGTQTNYRRLLRRVGAATLGPPTYPRRSLSLPKSPPKAPYSTAEISALAGWVRGLTTARLRRGALVLLGLGLGAGLRSDEIGSARANWIENEAGQLAVRIGVGPRPRRIPVVETWQWALENTGACAADDLLFLPGRATPRRKDVSAFTEGLPDHHAPKLSVQRLRVTWIVGRLDAGVPLHVCAAAAGVNPEQLAAYAAWLAPIPGAQQDRLLRSNGR